MVAFCDHLKKLKYSKTNPYAFTEHGAIMAASILNSSSAIEASLMIVRVFVKLRKMVESNSDLRNQIETLPTALPLSNPDKLLAIHEKNIK